MKNVVIMKRNMNIANALTMSRIIFALFILVSPVFTVSFYVFYLLGAVTDMIDGTIARILHQESPFGEKLDTVADLLFVIVILVKIITNVSIPLWLWIWITLIAIVKIFNIIYGFVVCRKIVAVHSVLNKITGLMLFVMPLTIGFPWKVLVAECILTCSVATFAAIQEGHHIRTGVKKMKRNGDKNMNVIYEHKNEMTFIGYHTEIAPNEGYQKCPEFWEKEYAAKYTRLFKTMKPETPVEEAILSNGIGMYAICADCDNSFTYWIAGLYKGGDVPKGLELFTFPESDWAIFRAKGSIPQSLQTLNTQVWEEWAPNIKKMYEIGASSLEVYSAGDPQSPEYECGIWVPIQKKNDLKICQSCGMPLELEDIFGTNADGSRNEDYCKYCYAKGEFIDKVSMEEYIEMCSQFGAQTGMTNEEMKEYCEKLFPMLKRWKQ